jgi:uncharacterized RDD family membrane protein YckC
MSRAKDSPTENEVLPFDAVRVETPEGVTLTLRVAGPLPRLYAALVDGAIRGFAYSLAAVALSLLGDLGEGPFLVVLFLGEWGYPVIFEVFRKGVTPGKGALKLKVVNGDGTPVNLTASALRNLLRVADFMPVGYAAGVLSILLTKDFQRLGDTVGRDGGRPRATARDQLGRGFRRPAHSPSVPCAPRAAGHRGLRRARRNLAAREGCWLAGMARHSPVPADRKA